MIVMGCPIASASVYPNIRCAPAFQAEITPSRFLAMIASFEDSTMESYRKRTSSARLREHMKTSRSPVTQNSFAFRITS
jgi:hypothetical protein